MSADRVRAGRASRWNLLGGAGVAALAIALRFIGLSWGLPNNDHYFSYHPDEVFLLLPSFGFAHGDWNPHFFNYGPLYLYLVGIPAVLLRLVPDPGSFPQNLRDLYLCGRAVTAILGVATVALLYVGLRRAAPRLALLSAFILAICPLHVINSHYATVDVPAAFLLVLAFVLLLRMAAHPNGRSAFVVGIVVGVAAATKYNAGLFAVAALLAPILLGEARPPRAWWMGVPAGALAGFMVTCPFFWTDEFRRGIMFEVQHARVGGTTAFLGTGSGWVYHLIRGIPVGLGYPLLAAMGLGLLATIRSPSLAGRLSLFWIALYLFAIGFGKERFIRYLVLLTPFFAVVAASGVLWLTACVRQLSMRISAAALVSAIVILTLVYTVWCLAPLATMDVRDCIWRESDLYSIRGEVGLAGVPWYFHPPVSPFNAGEFSRPSFEKWNADAGGRVLVTGWDPAALRRAKPEVFCLSDLESTDLLRLQDPSTLAFVEALTEGYSGREESGFPDPFPWLAPGREWAPPDWLYPSPHITVYYDWSE